MRIAPRSTTPPEPPPKRVAWNGAERGLLAVLAIAAMAISLLTAVSFGDPGTSPISRTPPAVLASSIPAGATDVPPRDPLVINASAGTLNEVALTSADGKPVAGTFSADRTRWTSATLAYAASYTATATGTDVDGSETKTLTLTFSTLKPGRTLAVESMRPKAGETVGVAMPISLYFSRPVVDRAAVESQLAVVPSVPTVGSWHWVGDDQVNWRPKEYWQSGTTVAVYSSLQGVDTGNGVYGGGNTVSTFAIGKDQRVIGDVTKHTLVMYENGVPINTLPASFGRSKFPTQYGVHVAFEKHPVKRMRSDTWAGGAQQGEPDYYDVEVPWAVRISANGEFVHVNASTVGQQGRANVSHGCVNLSPANGKMFYDWVQFGDPVEIIGSERPLTPKDGDILDWTIPWDQYTAGSALPA